MHPAIRIVEHIENLWSRDPRQAADRAQQVVVALINAGLIEGEILEGRPVKTQSAPATP